MVTADPARGVLITGESLVLQGVTRRRAGKYACVASNLEGDTQSNVVELNIKFKPVCANLAPVTQGLGRGRISRVVCPVLAHPPVTQFKWTFNNSVETVQVNFRNYGPFRLRDSTKKYQGYNNLNTFFSRKMG